VLQTGNNIALQRDIFMQFFAMESWVKIGTKVNSSMTTGSNLTRDDRCKVDPLVSLGPAPLGHIKKYMREALIAREWLQGDSTQGMVITLREGGRIRG
jgi:hypothetical protein